MLLTRLGRPVASQSRLVHDSLVPAGAGGRSSFSGQAATVFGSTGTLGHSLVNNLGRIGSSVTLPVRSVLERAQVQDLRIMGDLGALQFIQEFDMLRWSDDQINESIRYSNVVYNLIGSYKDTNHFSRRLTNVDWAERLATLVAEKDDGTRLIHVVHLNCEDESSQKYSKILSEQAEAIEKMRSIYPETIIVKSANYVGWRDRYCHYFCMDNEYYQRTLSKIGAFPLLYGAGQNTFVAPVRKMDVARALAKVGSHPDSPGHTFELFHDEVYKLGDLVEYMYDCKWSNMPSFDRTGYRVPGVLGQKDVDLDLFLWNGASCD
jgi:NADH dehydrogenase (ubiquinone) 1 alpha subcomplex subunit 9